MLREDENVLNDNISVTFSEINNNGYNIMISYFTNITNYYDYLKIKEEVNYKIIQILESKKIELAYNSYDVYIKNENK
jgi:MscS family membrane protein